MTSCPWCGTNQPVQPNCRNCGGPLPAAPIQQRPESLRHEIPVPPPAPREISDSYAWRLLLLEAKGIAAFVFTLLGAGFSLMGLILMLPLIFVGLPFAFFGF